MEIDVTKDQNYVVMALNGRMDATTTAEFDAAAQKNLDEGQTRILIDLKDLVYMSSAGLRSLLNLAKKTKALQGKIAFCNLQPMVAEVFRISGFDRILSVEADRTQALKILA
ncbi:MAG: STAS domain-containing protein [Desulfovibrionaceae bacterium]|nr:STAS domain-containing protein [Desulfovibrionaceae bacterium]